MSRDRTHYAGDGCQPAHADPAGPPLVTDDVIVANIHALSGHLDACLDALGHTNVHSIDWLRDWQQAEAGQPEDDTVTALRDRWIAECRAVDGAVHGPEDMMPAPAPFQRYPTDRPGWLGTGQPWPCGRCGNEADAESLHGCVPTEAKEQA